MSDIEQAQREVIEEFSAISDWRTRYQKIIASGRELPALDEAFRTEENIVRGCQNRVWLHAERMDDGRVRFYADSEAMIVRGLVALLVRIYSERTPEEILATEPRFIHELGLGENLTMNRVNGLAAMVTQMKRYAMVFHALSLRGG